MPVRVALFLIAIILPTHARGQQPTAAPRSFPQAPRPIAPPAVQQIPPGSASTSADDRRTLEAVRMDAGESITLDGRLDEDVWIRAVPATNLRQMEPDNGEPATEQTEVRVVYSADNLYIGATMFDSAPDKLIFYQMGRDGNLPADDKFQWVIDTFLDGRTAYWFEMNPLGSMADALRSNSMNNRQWDGIWNARSTRSDIGWTLEIEIPFRTLNFDPTGDTWGFNFSRTIARKNEDNLWMGWPRNQGLNRLNNAGRLTGIRNVTQGHGLDVKPYLAGTSESFPGRGDTRVTNDAQVGVDVFYNVTPGLRANLTVNTDFAQAEVDQRQVNLTRFSLLFPEKRDFFLDGTMFFDFASAAEPADGDRAVRDAGPDLIPFFSRRIGLDARNTPQRINFGSKLTGQVGSYDVGVLQVQTGEEEAALSEDFAVVRIKRRVMQQSYVGGLYTMRHARGGGIETRHTVGADVGLSTSTFRASKNLVANGFFLSAPAPAVSGKGLAFGGSVSYPNDPVNLTLDYMEVQENYDAAVGFTRRTGFRKIQPRVSFAPRPRQHPWLRRLNFGGNVDWRVDPDNNQTLTRVIDITALQIDTHADDSIQVQVIPTYELVEEDFLIAPGVTLPVGREYSFTRYRIQGSTANRRPIAVSPQVEWGSFFSGDRLRLGMTVNFRAAPGQMFTFANEWNRVSLIEGQFYTRLYRVIAETQVNPRISLVNNVQYDSQSDVVGWQSRFRWILTPGNDVYLVYIRNWLDDPLERRFYTLDRRLSLKALYTHRF